MQHASVLDKERVEALLEQLSDAERKLAVQGLLVLARAALTARDAK